MPVIDSPLRYPGGKSQLAPAVIEILRENDLFYGQYAEPFAGGAGIAWTLLLNSYVSQVFINDIDPAIHAFWHGVLNHTDEMCGRIDAARITIQEWKRQREYQDAKRPKVLDLAFSTFFLNRTNRSGIIRGGVIGGLSQDGAYKLDCRFNKEDLIRKIRRIGSHREQVELYKLDAIEFIRKVLRRAPTRTFVNLDPPYFVKGPGLYRNFYTPKDHADLAKAVGRIRHHWMVTYDDTAETRGLFSKYPCYAQDLNYSAQEKRIGTELVVFDGRLKIPAMFNELACLAA